ncbi:hypothetical protein [Methanorbis furvi]|uniref:hypothetical protein n=1 Tax=Methanorbis furvi TaxID=3028299 RepID=UPI0030B89B32
MDAQDKPTADFRRFPNLPIAVILRSGGTPANRLRPFRPHWITAGKFSSFFCWSGECGFFSSYSFTPHPLTFSKKCNQCESIIVFSHRSHYHSTKNQKKFASHYPVRSKWTEAISRSPDRTQDNDDWQIKYLCESVAFFSHEATLTTHQLAFFKKELKFFFQHRVTETDVVDT